MVEWETAHEFYVARINIQQIWLIDFFGGGYRMPLKDYYNGHDAPAIEFNVQNL